MSMRNNKMASRDDAYLPRDPLSRDRLAFETKGESLTRQSEAVHCDVNTIIERYTRTGQLPPSRRQGAFADVTDLQGDLTERAARARETIATADNFMREHEKKKKSSKPAEPSPAPAPAAPAAPATPAAPAAE